MEIVEVADMIMERMLQVENRAIIRSNFQSDSYFSDKGLNVREVHNGINHLMSHLPALVREAGNMKQLIEFTAEGRKVAAAGGLKAMERSAEIEKMQQSEEKNFLRLVNESILETNKWSIDANKSVIKTNESVQQTNESVQQTNESIKQVNKSIIESNKVNSSLADQTKRIYGFQRRTTILTIVVAIVAVGVAAIGAFSDAKQQRQMQKEIDSLKTMLKKDTTIVG